MNAPDNHTAWKTFTDLGVDFINTDKINELAQYLKVSSKKTARLTEMNNRTQSLIVRNAGLVLVCPFLDRLFYASGLLTNSKFKGKEEAALAIYMLNYLATGNKNSVEQDLFIPKVLVGLDPESEVPSITDPGDSILTECDQLLAALIMQWSGLKSTLPYSLRETFLKRSALIERKDDGWYFIFERRGVDILLNQLPFGISVIKLEWLIYPIWITW